MKMKGITCCGDCVYYNIKKHKCIRCENVEPEDAREHFYADCPLPDAEPVRHGKWIKFNDNGIEYQTCSECNYDMQVGGADSWCPACGSKMDGD